MARLDIKLERNTEIAKKILKGWQFLFFEMHQKVIFGIITKSLRDYKLRTYEGNYIFFEEGTPEEIKEKKEQLEAFLFSDAEDFKKRNYVKYGSSIENKFVRSVQLRYRHYKDSIKNKMIKTAIGQNTVMGFFSNVGIYITWEAKII